MTAQAAGFFYGCKVLFWRSGKHGFAFIGRPDNTDAAEMTMMWLTQQIKELYKANLPKGLTQPQRQEFRKTFKVACAHRVYLRAAEFVANPSADCFRHQVDGPGRRRLLQAVAVGECGRPVRHGNRSKPSTRSSQRQRHPPAGFADGPTPSSFHRQSAPDHSALHHHDDREHPTIRVWDVEYEFWIEIKLEKAVEAARAAYVRMGLRKLEAEKCI